MVSANAGAYKNNTFGNLKQLCAAKAQSRMEVGGRLERITCKEISS